MATPSKAWLFAILMVSQIYDVSAALSHVSLIPHVSLLDRSLNNLYYGNKIGKDCVMEPENYTKDVTFYVFTCPPSIRNMELAFEGSNVCDEDFFQINENWASPLVSYKDPVLKKIYSCNISCADAFSLEDPLKDCTPYMFDIYRDGGDIASLSDLAFTLTSEEGGSPLDLKPDFDPVVTNYEIHVNTETEFKVSAVSKEPQTRAGIQLLNFPKNSATGESLLEGQNGCHLGVQRHGAWNVPAMKTVGQYLYQVCAVSASGEFMRIYNVTVEVHPVDSVKIESIEILTPGYTFNQQFDMHVYEYQINATGQTREIDFRIKTHDPRAPMSFILGSRPALALDNCTQDTGGTCYSSFCDASRGNATCHRDHHRCFCHADECAVNGECVKPYFARHKSPIGEAKINLKMHDNQHLKLGQLPQWTTEMQIQVFPSGGDAPPETYKVSVIQHVDTYSKLHSLTSGNCDLDPPFDPDTHEYKCVWPWQKEQIWGAFTPSFGENEEAESNCTHCELLIPDPKVDGHLSAKFSQPDEAIHWQSHDNAKEEEEVWNRTFLHGEQHDVAVLVLAEDRWTRTQYTIHLERWAPWYFATETIRKIAEGASLIATIMAVVGGANFMALNKMMQFLRLIAEVDGVPTTFREFTEKLHSYDLDISKYHIPGVPTYKDLRRMRQRAVDELKADMHVEEAALLAQYCYGVRMYGPPAGDALFALHNKDAANLIASWDRLLSKQLAKEAERKKAMEQKKKDAKISAQTPTDETDDTVNRLRRLRELMQIDESDMPTHDHHLREEYSLTTDLSQVDDLHDFIELDEESEEYFGKQHKYPKVYMWSHKKWDSFIDKMKGDEDWGMPHNISCWDSTLLRDTVYTYEMMHELHIVRMMVRSATGTFVVSVLGLIIVVGGYIAYYFFILGSNQARPTLAEPAILGMFLMDYGMITFARKAIKMMFSEPEDVGLKKFQPTSFMIHCAAWAAFISYPVMFCFIVMMIIKIVTTKRAPEDAKAEHKTGCMAWLCKKIFFCRIFKTCTDDPIRKVKAKLEDSISVDVDSVEAPVVWDPDTEMWTDRRCCQLSVKQRPDVTKRWGPELIIRCAIPILDEEKEELAFGEDQFYFLDRQIVWVRGKVQGVKLQIDPEELEKMEEEAKAAAQSKELGVSKETLSTGEVKALKPATLKRGNQITEEDVKPTPVPRNRLGYVMRYSGDVHAGTVINFSGEFWLIPPEQYSRVIIQRIRPKDKWIWIKGGKHKQVGSSGTFEAKAQTEAEILKVERLRDDGVVLHMNVKTDQGVKPVAIAQAQGESLLETVVPEKMRSGKAKAKRAWAKRRMMEAMSAKQADLGNEKAGEDLFGKQAVAAKQAEENRRKELEKERSEKHKIYMDKIKTDALNMNPQTKEDPYCKFWSFNIDAKSKTAKPQDFQDLDANGKPTLRWPSTFTEANLKVWKTVSGEELEWQIYEVNGSRDPKDMVKWLTRKMEETVVQEAPKPPKKFNAMSMFRKVKKTIEKKFEPKMAQFDTWSILLKQDMPKPHPLFTDYCRTDGSIPEWLEMRKGWDKPIPLGWMVKNFESKKNRDDDDVLAPEETFLIKEYLYNMMLKDESLARYNILDIVPRDGYLFPKSPETQGPDGKITEDLFQPGHDFIENSKGQRLVWEKYTTSLSSIIKKFSVGDGDIGRLSAGFAELGLFVRWVFAKAKGVEDGGFVSWQGEPSGKSWTDHIEEGRSELPSGQHPIREYANKWQWLTLAFFEEPWTKDESDEAELSFWDGLRIVATKLTGGKSSTTLYRWTKKYMPFLSMLGDLNAGFVRDWISHSSNFEQKKCNEMRQWMWAQRMICMDMKMRLAWCAAQHPKFFKPMSVDEMARRSFRMTYFFVNNSSPNMEKLLPHEKKNALKNTGELMRFTLSKFEDLYEPDDEPWWDAADQPGDGEIKVTFDQATFFQTKGDKELERRRQDQSLVPEYGYASSPQFEIYPTVDVGHKMYNVMKPNGYPTPMKATLEMRHVLPLMNFSTDMKVNVPMDTLELPYKRALGTVLNGKGKSERYMYSVDRITSLGSICALAVAAVADGWVVLAIFAGMKSCSLIWQIKTKLTQEPEEEEDPYYAEEGYIKVLTDEEVKGQLAAQAKEEDEQKKKDEEATKNHIVTKMAKRYGGVDLPTNWQKQGMWTFTETVIVVPFVEVLTLCTLIGFFGNRKWGPHHSLACIIYAVLNMIYMNFNNLSGTLIAMADKLLDLIKWGRTQANIIFEWIKSKWDTVVGEERVAVSSLQVVVPHLGLSIPAKAQVDKALPFEDQQAMKASKLLFYHTTSSDVWDQAGKKRSIVETNRYKDVKNSLAFALETDQLLQRQAIPEVVATIQSVNHTNMKKLCSKDNDSYLTLSKPLNWKEEWDWDKDMVEMLLRGWQTQAESWIKDQLGGISSRSTSTDEILSRLTWLLQSYCTKAVRRQMRSVYIGTLRLPKREKVVRNRLARLNRMIRGVWNEGTEFDQLDGKLGSVMFLWDKENLATDFPTQRQSAYAEFVPVEPVVVKVQIPLIREKKKTGVRLSLDAQGMWIAVSIDEGVINNYNQSNNNRLLNKHLAEGDRILEITRDKKRLELELWNDETNPPGEYIIKFQKADGTTLEASCDTQLDGWGPLCHWGEKELENEDGEVELEKRWTIVEIPDESIWSKHNTRVLNSLDDPARKLHHTEWGTAVQVGDVIRSVRRHEKEETIMLVDIERKCGISKSEGRKPTKGAWYKAENITLEEAKNVAVKMKDIAGFYVKTEGKPVKDDEVLPEVFFVLEWSSQTNPLDVDEDYTSWHVERDEDIRYHCEITSTLDVPCPLGSTKVRMAVWAQGKEKVKPQKSFRAKLGQTAALWKTRFGEMLEWLSDPEDKKNRHFSLLNEFPDEEQPMLTGTSEPPSSSPPTDSSSAASADPDMIFVEELQGFTPLIELDEMESDEQQIYTKFGHADKRTISPIALDAEDEWLQEAGPLKKKFYGALKWVREKYRDYRMGFNHQSKVEEIMGDDSLGYCSISIDKNPNVISKGEDNDFQSNMAVKDTLRSGDAVDPVKLMRHMDRWLDMAKVFGSHGYFQVGPDQIEKLEERLQKLINKSKASAAHRDVSEEEMKKDDLRRALAKTEVFGHLHMQVGSEAKTKELALDPHFKDEVRAALVEHVGAKFGIPDVQTIQAKVFVSYDKKEELVSSTTKVELPQIEEEPAEAPAPEPKKDDKKNKKDKKNSKDKKPEAPPPPPPVESNSSAPPADSRKSLVEEDEVEYKTVPVWQLEINFSVDIGREPSKLAKFLGGEVEEDDKDRDMTPSPFFQEVQRKVTNSKKMENGDEIADSFKFQYQSCVTELQRAITNLKDDLEEVKKRHDLMRRRGFELMPVPTDTDKDKERIEKMEKDRQEEAKKAEAQPKAAAKAKAAPKAEAKKEEEKKDEKKEAKKMIQIVPPDMLKARRVGDKMHYLKEYSTYKEILLEGLRRERAELAKGKEIVHFAFMSDQIKFNNHWKPDPIPPHMASIVINDSADAGVTEVKVLGQFPIQPKGMTMVNCPENSPQRVFKKVVRAGSFGSETVLINGRPAFAAGVSDGKPAWIEMSLPNQKLSTHFGMGPKESLTIEAAKRKADENPRIFGFYTEDEVKNENKDKVNVYFVRALVPMDMTDEDKKSGKVFRAYKKTSLYLYWDGQNSWTISPFCGEPRPYGNMAHLKEADAQRNLNFLFAKDRTAYSPDMINAKWMKFQATHQKVGSKSVYHGSWVDVNAEEKKKKHGETAQSSNATLAAGATAPPTAADKAAAQMRIVSVSKQGSSKSPYLESALRDYELEMENKQTCGTIVKSMMPAIVTSALGSLSDLMTLVSKGSAIKRDNSTKDVLVGLSANKVTFRWKDNNIENLAPFRRWLLNKYGSYELAWLNMTRHKEIKTELARRNLSQMLFRTKLAVDEQTKLAKETEAFAVEADLIMQKMKKLQESGVTTPDGPAYADFCREMQSIKNQELLMHFEVMGWNGTALARDSAFFDQSSEIRDSAYNRTATNIEQMREPWGVLAGVIRMTGVFKLKKESDSYLGGDIGKMLETTEDDLMGKLKAYFIEMPAPTFKVETEIENSTATEQGIAKFLQTQVRGVKITPAKTSKDKDIVTIETSDRENFEIIVKKIEEGKVKGAGPPTEKGAATTWTLDKKVQSVTMLVPIYAVTEESNKETNRSVVKKVSDEYKQKNGAKKAEAGLIELICKEGGVECEMLPDKVINKAKDQAKAKKLKEKGLKTDEDTSVEADPDVDDFSIAARHALGQFLEDGLYAAGGEAPKKAEAAQASRGKPKAQAQKPLEDNSIYDKLADMIMTSLDVSGDGELSVEEIHALYEADTVFDQAKHVFNFRAPLGDAPNTSSLIRGFTANVLTKENLMSWLGKDKYGSVRVSVDLNLGDDTETPEFCVIVTGILLPGQWRENEKEEAKKIGLKLKQTLMDEMVKKHKVKVEVVGKNKKTTTETKEVCYAAIVKKKQGVKDVTSASNLEDWTCVDEKEDKFPKRVDPDFFLEQFRLWLALHPQYKAMENMWVELSDDLELSRDDLTVALEDSIMEVRDPRFEGGHGGGGGEGEGGEGAEAVSEVPAEKRLDRIFADLDAQMSDGVTFKELQPGSGSSMESVDQCILSFDVPLSQFREFRIQSHKSGMGGRKSIRLVLNTAYDNSPEWSAVRLALNPDWEPVAGQESLEIFMPASKFNMWRRVIQDCEMGVPTEFIRQYNGEYKDHPSLGGTMMRHTKKGVQHWSTGKVYEGGFADHVYEGYGTLWASDVDRESNGQRQYYGEWHRGKRHGYGTMVWDQDLAAREREGRPGASIRKRYVGAFENDLFKGRGILQLENALVIKDLATKQTKKAMEELRLSNKTDYNLIPLPPQVGPHQLIKFDGSFLSDWDSTDLSTRLLDPKYAEENPELRRIGKGSKGRSQSDGLKDLLLERIAPKEMKEGSIGKIKCDKYFPRDNLGVQKAGAPMPDLALAAYTLSSWKLSEMEENPGGFDTKHMKKGQAFYADGTTYFGEFADGRPDGDCEEMVQKAHDDETRDVSTYRGQMKRGRKHGWGRYVVISYDGTERMKAFRVEAGKDSKEAGIVLGEAPNSAQKTISVKELDGLTFEAYCEKNKLIAVKDNAVITGVRTDEGIFIRGAAFGHSDPHKKFWISPKVAIELPKHMEDLAHLVYTGNYQSNLKNGFGILQIPFHLRNEYKAWSYAGEWADDVYNGLGELQYGLGGEYVYVGPFKRGRRDGSDYSLGTEEAKNNRTNPALGKAYYQDTLKAGSTYSKLGRIGYAGFEIQLWDTKNWKLTEKWDTVRMTMKQAMKKATFDGCVGFVVEGASADFKAAFEAKRILCYRDCAKKERHFDETKLYRVCFLKKSPIQGKSPLELDKIRVPPSPYSANKTTIFFSRTVDFTITMNAKFICDKVCGHPDVAEELKIEAKNPLAGWERGWSQTILPNGNRGGFYFGMFDKVGRRTGRGILFEPAAIADEKFEEALDNGFKYWHESAEDPSKWALGEEAISRCNPDDFKDFFQKFVVNGNLNTHLKYVNYFGQWKDNVPHGFGIQVFQGKGAYVGWFADGLRQGRGVWATMDGKWKYEPIAGALPNWDKDVMHGVAKITHKDGESTNIFENVVFTKGASQVNFSIAGGFNRIVAPEKTIADSDTLSKAKQGAGQISSKDTGLGTFKALLDVLKDNEGQKENKGHDFPALVRQRTEELTVPDEDMLITYGRVDENGLESENYFVSGLYFKVAGAFGMPAYRIVKAGTMLTQPVNRFLWKDGRSNVWVLTDEPFGKVSLQAGCAFVEDSAVRPDMIQKNWFVWRGLATNGFIDAPPKPGTNPEYVPLSPPADSISIEPVIGFEILGAQQAEEAKDPEKRLSGLFVRKPLQLFGRPVYEAEMKPQYLYWTSKTAVDEKSGMTGEWNSDDVQDASKLLNAKGFWVISSKVGQPFVSGSDILAYAEDSAITPFQIKPGKWKVYFQGKHVLQDFVKLSISTWKKGTDVTGAGATLDFMESLAKSGQTATLHYPKARSAAASSSSSATA